MTERRCAHCGSRYLIAYSDGRASCEDCGGLTMPPRSRWRSALPWLMVAAAALFVVAILFRSALP